MLTKRTQSVFSVSSGIQRKHSSGPPAPECKPGFFNFNIDTLIWWILNIWRRKRCLLALSPFLKVTTLQWRSLHARNQISGGDNLFKCLCMCAKNVMLTEMLVKSAVYIHQWKNQRTQVVMRGRVATPQLQISIMASRNIIWFTLLANYFNGALN